MNNQHSEPLALIVNRQTNKPFLVTHLCMSTWSNSCQKWWGGRRQAMRAVGKFRKDLIPPKTHRKQKDFWKFKAKNTPKIWSCFIRGNWNQGCSMLSTLPSSCYSKNTFRFPLINWSKRKYFLSAFAAGHCGSLHILLVESGISPFPLPSPQSCLQVLSLKKIL